MRDRHHQLDPPRRVVVRLTSVAQVKRDNEQMKKMEEDMKTLKSEISGHRDRLVSWPALLFRRRPSLLRCGQSGILFRHLFVALHLRSVASGAFLAGSHRCAAVLLPPTAADVGRCLLPVVPPKISMVLRL